MNRAVFLFALAAPLISRAPSRLDAPLETVEVGPTVLMNRARQTSIFLVDLRATGRAVPGATKNRAAPPDAEIFALGDLETARRWAKRFGLTSVWVVPPRLIEFKPLPDVPQIAPRDAWEKVNRGGWPLFDLSESVEFNALRLPGSKRLDYLGVLGEKLAAIPKNRPFIVACRVGHRSQLVVRRLRALGFDARNLSGGLWEWQCQNLPLQGEMR